MDANGVLRKYEAGEKKFREQNLNGVGFIKANLSGVDSLGHI